MEEQNDLLLEQDEKQYPEKWLKIGVKVGILGAGLSMFDLLGEFKSGDEDLLNFLGVVSFIGEAVFTIVQAIFLYLITCKMKSNNMQKPSVLLFYILIASSCLASFVWFFDDDSMIGLIIYLAMLLITGYNCRSTSETKKLGNSMLLLPVGFIVSAIIVGIVLDVNPRIKGRWTFLLMILPYMAAVIFYLESCSKFLKSSKPKEVPAQD
ncbi:MAG: hypothetical protein J1E84_01220 [Muribaculaceae bacterium]|nr:hypothetical protein [Muribaculaceae bacterium]